MFDLTRMVFYDSNERARFRRRISSLLAALYACQILSMNSFELRAYLEREQRTAEELERTHFFVEMVERYKTCACVGGVSSLFVEMGERHNTCACVLPSR